MSLTAMWVPGTAARVEYPERLTSRPPVPAPSGFPPNPPLRDIGINGAVITFSQQNFSGAVNSNWFHFPIPTPVILNDTRLQLLRVFVLFHAQLATISRVHIWDGPNLLFELNSVGQSGDHLGQIDASNTFPMNANTTFSPSPPVFFGLNISVEVDFLPEAASNPMIRSLVVFSTAGADFLVP